MESLSDSQSPWTMWFIPVLLVVLSFMVGLVTRKLLFGFLRKVSQRTETKLDDIIIESIRGAYLLWFVILGIYLAMRFAVLPERIVDLANTVLTVLWVISATIVTVKMTNRFIATYADRLPARLPITSVTRNIARIAVVVMGSLIVLDILGISITPMLTAIGIGGLAVALALQSTLSNMFAGFYVTVAREVRIGDYVKLDTGQEGYVSDIGWRTTRIQMLQNNVVIVPNSRLAESIITNYHLPETEMSLLIPVSVSYDADPDRVEKILIEEAKEGARSIPGLLPEPEPFVRFIPGFGEFSLDFTLICRVREFVDQYLAQHELRKRIFRRFKKEGIEIPFPIRTVYLRDGQKVQQRV